MHGEPNRREAPRKAYRENTRLPPGDAMTIPHQNASRSERQRVGTIGAADGPSSSEDTAGRWHVEPLSEQDIPKAVRLFHDTVHAINAHDYSEEQLSAWAPGDDASLAAIAKRLKGQQTVGVKAEGFLVGFGSLDETGDFDMLFVEKSHQRQGIARCIAKDIERLAADRGHTAIGAFVSITARPFFERMGYAVKFENIAVRNGIELTNYRMEKQL